MLVLTSHLLPASVLGSHHQVSPPAACHLPLPQGPGNVDMEVIEREGSSVDTGEGK